MSKLEELFEFCITDRQVEVLKTVIECDGNYAEASRKMESSGLKRIARQNIADMIKGIKKRATAFGKGSSHFVANMNIPVGLAVKGTTTMYRDRDGNIQWVKTDREKEKEFEAINEAIDSMVEKIDGKALPTTPPTFTLDNLLATYITNDLHFGALMYAKETRDRDYDLQIAKQLVSEAVEYLVNASPACETAILADLGDLLEMDDFSNATKRSGNQLDVDTRYSLVVEIVYETIVILIDNLLKKHNKVKFINIKGNHDDVTSLAVKAFVNAWYRNEPRVEVDMSGFAHKYHLHGKTLLGFAHGHEMKMHDASEVMAMHNLDIISNTSHRFYHFGHNHKDKVIDGRLCKAESHRNLPPVNMWASEMGYGRGAGTMKCIIYDTERGEISRNTFVVG